MVDRATWLGAATSVAAGAAYMLATGAPRRYVVVNVAALTLGFAAASVMRRIPARDPNLAGGLTLAIGLLMVIIAFAGVEVDGASRWIRVAGLSLQPSLILLPVALVHFARNRGWLSSIGLAFASLGSTLQPDRALAGMLAAGLAALWLYRREPPITVALAAAMCAVTATMLQDDLVAPVPFVEQVVHSAFAFHGPAGVAIVGGLATMLLPAAAGWGPGTHEREMFAVFGATWLAVIAYSIVGNYPTPLVGHGSSAIVGYCLSAGALRRS